MNKKAIVFFKAVFILSFVSFMTFYISLQSGYYEYNNRRKMTFTKEQIEQFESDVQSGRSVDVTEYLKNTDKDYQNKISRATLNISEVISKYTKKGVNIIFTKIGNAIEESWFYVKTLDLELNLYYTYIDIIC